MPDPSDAGHEDLVVLSDPVYWSEHPDELYEALRAWRGSPIRRTERRRRSSECGRSAAFPDGLSAT